MPLITSHLNAVHERINAAARMARRDPAAIKLLAVSKTFDADAIRDAYMAGQRAFGENYLQEALSKMALLVKLREQLEWHFIGPLQSNKTGLVAQHFDWVHSVDRFKIAQRLSAQRPQDMPPLNVCVQVNISGEATKNGVAPEAVAALARDIMQLPNLRLRGLMSIPEPTASLAKQRAPHQRLRTLLEALNANGLALDTLSMGMSADLEAAILEGATIVRAGTAIFGTRTPSTPSTK